MKGVRHEADRGPLFYRGSLGRRSRRRGLRGSRRGLGSFVSDGYCKGGGDLGLTLDIDSPFFRIEAECFEGSLLTEAFSFVDVRVSAVVAGAGIAFGVFIWCKDSDADVPITPWILDLAHFASHFPAYLVLPAR